MNIFQKAIFHLRIFSKYIKNNSGKKLFDYCYLKWHGVETSYGFVELKGLPIIDKTNGSRIILGRGCTLVSKSKYNQAGINHPVILATLSSTAKIQIGSTGISGSSICCVSEIVIGDNCALGANSCIYDTDFHPTEVLKRRYQSSIFEAKTKKIRIGDDVWIGANTIVLKGVNIGVGSVIGPCSVVITDVPTLKLFRGNPATEVRGI